MGILDFIFGSTPSGFHELVELPRHNIERIVSPVRFNSLTQGEEDIVEREIAAARQGDGQITLARIDAVLKRLDEQNKISFNDRKTLLKAFQQYFKEKQGKK